MHTVLITGANRGLGLALTTAYQRNGSRVIAAVRDLSKAPRMVNVIPVKIDSESVVDAAIAARDLETKYGIKKLDLVIANAASGIAWEYLKDTSIDDFDLLYRTNLRGPLVLFQACQSLLSRKDDVGLEEIPSPNEARDGVFLPQTEGEVVLKSVDVVEKKGGIEKVKDEWRSKFVIISSLQGQFNRDPGTNLGGYGIMKAAVNYMARKIHFEHPEIISFSLNPGAIDTDMGWQGAAWRGLEKPPMSLADNLPEIIRTIDEATKDFTSGRMVNFDGSLCEW